MEKRIRVGEQVVVCDRAATVALYCNIDIPDRRDADCVLWAHFITQLKTLYPRDFLDLLDELGADSLKELGPFIYDCAPGESHNHCGGYFVFVGELLEGTTWRPRHNLGSFTYWFMPHCPHREQNVCAVEFHTDIPAVISEAHRHDNKPNVSLSNLSEKERDVIRECLRVTVESALFPDWEFEIIFGLSRDDVKRVLTAWPEVNDADNWVANVINNSLNNVLGYPSNKKAEIWANSISVDGPAVMRIMDKWRGREQRTSWKPRNYFDDLML